MSKIQLLRTNQDHVYHYNGRTGDDSYSVFGTVDGFIHELRFSTTEMAKLWEQSDFEQEVELLRLFALFPTTQDLGFQLNLHWEQWNLPDSWLTLLRGVGQRKYIRPKLYLSLRDSPLIDEDFQMAAALELIHVATCVSDDLVDGDEERRGVPSLHAAMGEEYTIFSAQGMLLEALKHIPSPQINLPPLLAGYGMTGITGEQIKGLADIATYKYPKIDWGFQAIFILGGLRSGLTDYELWSQEGRWMSEFFMRLDDIKDNEIRDTITEDITQLLTYYEDLQNSSLPQETKYLIEELLYESLCMF